MNPCETPCPKCGSADIHRQFHARGSTVKNDSYAIARYAGFNTAVGGWESYARNDCIVHHCRTCQYDWTGKTLKKQRPKRTAVSESEDRGR